MTYDQAQSPRLGQRVPIESTYVQIVDVDPATALPDLPEVAYPGQLIFRQDLGILQIWSLEDDTWLSVAGGVAGQLTFVGDNQPTGAHNTGDIWYDSDAAYKQYVYDADPTLTEHWIPVTTTVPPVVVVDKITTLVTSVMGQNSILTLENAVVAPVRVGTSTQTYTTNGYPDDGQWPNRYGWAISPSGTYAFTARLTSSNWYIERWNLSTKARDRNYNATNAYSMITVGIAWDDNRCLWMGHPTSNPNNKWELRVWDTSLNGSTALYMVGAGYTGALPLNTNNAPGFCQQGPVVGPGATIYVAWNDLTSGTLKLSPALINDGSTPPRLQTSGTVLTTTLAPGSANIGSLLYGNFDLGAARYLLWYRSTTSTTVGDVLVFDPATGLEVTPEEWPRLTTWNCNGAYWNGTKFLSMQYGVLVTYEGGGNYWKTASGTWWLSYAWTDGGSQHTTLAPPLKVTMTKRARLFFDTPTLAPGVTAASCYLARQDTTAPAVTGVNYTLQGAGYGLAGGYEFSLLSADFSTPNNPIASSFGAGTPALIRSRSELPPASGNPDAWIDGNGSWRLAPLGSHNATVSATLDQLYDTGWQDHAGGAGSGNFTGSSYTFFKWRRIGEMVTVQLQKNCSSSFTPGSTNYTNQNINGVGIPAAIRPSDSMECAARWDDSSVGMTLASNGIFILTGGRTQGYSAGDAMAISCTYMRG